MGSDLGPFHTPAFHAIFDQVATGLFDHAGRDRVILSEVFFAPHAIAVSSEAASLQNTFRRCSNG